MATEYSLMMQKTADGSEVKDSLADFGCAVSELQWPAVETQEVASRTWPGEHGEDVYIPQSGLKLKAYEMEVEFCYKGDVNTAYTAYKALRDYFIGEGGLLRIYDPYWKIGRKGVYLKKFDNIEPYRSDVDEVMPFKVILFVTDPVTDIAAVTNASGEIISLGAV